MGLEELRRRTRKMRVYINVCVRVMCRFGKEGVTIFRPSLVLFDFGDMNL